MFKFAGKVRQEWLDQAASMGVDLVQNKPNDGYLAFVDSRADLFLRSSALVSFFDEFHNLSPGDTASFTYRFVISTTFTPCGSSTGFDVVSKTCTELTPAGSNQLDVFTVPVGQQAAGSPT